MVTRRAFVGGLLGVVAALCAAPALEAAPAESPNTIRFSELQNPDEWWEAFEVGDVFTIEGRYAVDPITQKSTGVLQRFVVTETTTAERLAAAPWRVYPRMIDAGPYRNVNDAGPFQASDVRLEYWPSIVDASKPGEPRQYRRGERLAGVAELWQ